MVIPAVLLKITRLPLTKSTFYYKYIWPEYVAYFLFKCMFQHKVPPFCHLKNGQSEYSQESREHQQVQMQLCAGLFLPWDTAGLPSPSIHSLLKYFWLEYEIGMLLLLVSKGLVWVLFAATSGKTASCEHVEGRCAWLIHSCTVKILMEMGRGVLAGRSLTSSGKSLYSCAESQMRSIPVLLLLSPGNWHRNSHLGFSKHFHSDCTKDGI